MWSALFTSLLIKVDRKMIYIKLTPGPIGPIPGFIPMYIFVSPELVESER